MVCGEGNKQSRKKKNMKVSYVRTRERGEITTGRSEGRESSGWNCRAGGAGAATCEPLTSLCENQGLQLSQHGSVGVAGILKQHSCVNTCLAELVGSVGMCGDVV